MNLKIIEKYQLQNINVDTTIQEKYIQFPRDSKLYYNVIKKLTKTGKKIGIEFSENYARYSKYLRNKLIRVTNFKDLKKIVKKLKNYLRKNYKRF